MNDTLHLPLMAKWYDMIESGVKPEEYRAKKPYWIKRLCDMPVQYIEEDPCSNCLLCAGMSRFSRVCFSYGYTKRRMTWELERIRIGYGNPEWGAPKDEEVFIIKLGRRIE